MCNDLQVYFSNFPVSSKLDSFLPIADEGTYETILETSILDLFSVQKTWVGTIYLMIFFDFFIFNENSSFFDLKLDIFRHRYLFEIWNEWKKFEMEKNQQQ